jgi:NAD(P)-dependent dehydrogenase (short-subunit alcohol dehydrogenase family)
VDEVQDSSGGVALVTGASRGIGRGIALALGDAGVTVYVTGRSAIDETARLAADRGGRVVPLPCDHRDDLAVEEVFRRIEAEAGRLDILVNNATAIPDLGFLFSDRPFWDMRSDVWDDLMTVGLRSHFIASQHAARMMIRQGNGLIVNISSAGAKTKIGILPYGVGKAALDHLTVEMAAELRAHGVGVVSLWPPPSKTEGMLADASEDTNTAAWSSTEFTGRVIAALANQDRLARSGDVISVRALAEDLGVEDDADLGH